MNIINTSESRSAGRVPLEPPWKCQSGAASQSGYKSGFILAKEVTKKTQRTNQTEGHNFPEAPPVTSAGSRDWLTGRRFAESEH